MSSTPPRRALVVIDPQNEYVTGRLRVTHPPIDESLLQIGRAMDVARAAGVPVVMVQHLAPESSPIFARGSDAAALHPSVAGRPRDHFIEKSQASVFAGTDFAEWLKANGVDTITVAGYMTQNCNASTIYEAAHRGFSVEYLRDASGAVAYSNEAGTVTAEEIHRTYCAVFHSRFAAVATTDAWIAAVKAGEVLPKGNIPASAAAGRPLT